MQQMSQFEARIQRIATNTKVAPPGGIYVGDATVAELQRRGSMPIQRKQTRRSSTSSQAAQQASVPGMVLSCVIGAVAVLAVICMQFHIGTAEAHVDLVRGAMTSKALVVDLGKAAALAVLFLLVIGQGNLGHFIAMGAGVAICTMGWPNLAHLAPELMAKAFSPLFVTQVTSLHPWGAFSVLGQTIVQM